MSRRVFLSYPMVGESRERCLRYREEMVRNLRYDDEWIDNLDCEGPEYGEATRLWYLGEAIKKLGTCDCIMVHPFGWNRSGCKIELEVAKQYGIPVIDIKEPYFEKFCGGNVRATNVLRRNGICSRIALMRATEEEIKNFRNCGKQTFEYIMKLKESLE